MSIKFTKLSKVLIIATVASLFAIEAKAETEPSAELFEVAYFKNGEDAFVQSGIFGQITTIVGIPKFPEQDIAADGKEIHNTYEYVLELQTSLGEPVVTRDLDNPYNTSLRENPNYGEF